MTDSAVDAAVARATAVSITNSQLTLELIDGRSLSVPIAWSPRLASATPEERGNGGSLLMVKASTGRTSTRTLVFAICWRAESPPRTRNPLAAGWIPETLSARDTRQPTPVDPSPPSTQPVIPSAARNLRNKERNRTTFLRKDFPLPRERVRVRGTPKRPNNHDRPKGPPLPEL